MTLVVGAIILTQLSSPPSRLR